MSDRSDQGAVSVIPKRPRYAKKDDGYEMEYVIPCNIPQDAIEVSVEEENILTVRGRAENRETLEIGDSGEQKEDVYFSTFERSVRLPLDGNLSNVKTSIEDIEGDSNHRLLKVHVPMMR